MRGPRFGLWSGIGLVVGNTIGVGVLTSTGYMAKDLGPGMILAAWAIGGLIALAGVVVYSHIAQRIPRSGGEYRYLSELLHPSLGYLAGWTSLLVGFSAPVAVAAYTAGCFAETLHPSLDARWFAIGIIVVTTLMHAVSGRVSVRSQNALAAVKLLAFVGLLGAALVLGSNRWPDWHAAHEGEAATGFPAGPFFISLVYIAYAFSGWNTAIYAAEDVDEPRRNVPRAMILGTLVIVVLYLAVNWVFVSNLSAERMTAWADTDTQRVTLAHVVTADLVGPNMADLISVVLILMLASSISSMTITGPHVYSAMAKDGLLPSLLIRRDDRLPVASVLVQSALAVAMLMTHSFEALITNIGAMLTLTSALTVIGALRTRPRPFVLACAGIYTISSCWILYYVFAESPVTLSWALIAAALGVAGFLNTRASSDTSAARE